MKIITLNTWGGRAGKDRLLQFFKKNAGSTDVFCLQEIWSDRHYDLDGVLAGGRPIDNENTMTHGLQEIGETLTDFTSYFRPHFLENYGLCLFIRNGLKVIEEGDFFVHYHKGYYPDGDVGNHARNIQFVTLRTTQGALTIINFHGLWNGKGKGDCEERIAQSSRMIDFIRTLKNPYILCGDFNLVPDSESLKMLEKEGLRNLIKEYGITSTRTSFYTKPERYADYALVSDGVEVEDFKVLPDEVSDHAPLLVEIKAEAA